MSTGASINEPFLLATYDTSKCLSKPVIGTKSYRRSEHVFATHEPAPGSPDGYVTVAAQADGVHVLDVSTLHPMISHTLGPSTAFSCPALTRIGRPGAENVCFTYAAIEAAPDLGPEEGGRTIWMWQQNLASPLTDRAWQKKKSMVMPHHISGLYACDELSSQLLVLSPKGDVTVIDADLCSKHTRKSVQDTSDLLQAFVYPRRSCSFAPSHTTPTRGAILLLLVASEFDSVQVQILSVDDDNSFLTLGICPLPFKRNELSDISCSASGFLSILSRDGSWCPFQAESLDGDCISISPVTEAFRLKGLSFNSNQKTVNRDVSLLALGSSHVLFAAITQTPTREIVLLLWDLKYSALLASYALAIPSTLSQSEDVPISLTLVASSSSQALLVVSPNPSSSSPESRTSSRSSVIVVPFTAPTTSTIANAMGRGSAGAKWISNDSSLRSSSPVGQLTHEAARSKVLAAMRSAVRSNRPQAADAAFFEWEQSEKASGEPMENSDLVGSTPLSGMIQHKISVRYPALGYSFVKDLLATILQLENPANPAYSPEVLRYLLERRVVSAGMIEGRLLEVLRSKNDWDSLELALENVLDISEAEIMESLQYVVRQRRSIASTNTNAMQVDSESASFPPLPAILASCIGYSTSASALRSAMRLYLTDPDDIFPILQILDHWIVKWSKMDVELLPSEGDVVKNEHGVPSMKAEPKEVNRNLPPLNQILSFLQTLLDASFLTLLQYPRSHHILRNVVAHIEPEMTFMDQIEQLQGPLVSFSKAHMKATKEASGDKQKAPLADWRQRRKQKHDQVGLSVGLYRLEELVL